VARLAAAKRIYTGLSWFVKGRGSAEKPLIGLQHEEIILVSEDVTEPKSLIIRQLICSPFQICRTNLYPPSVE
jgi:hypothetical protein